MRMMFFMLAVVFVLLVLVGMMCKPPAGRADHDKWSQGTCRVYTPNASLNPVEREAVRLINEHRAAHGVPALELAVNLHRAANWKANDMATHGYFGHSPDSLGRDPFQLQSWCQWDGNRWRGENIGVGHITAQQIVDGWKASPGHNAILLSSNMRYYGIAQIYGWYGQWYAPFWVLHVTS